MPNTAERSFQLLLLELSDFEAIEYELTRFTARHINRSITLDSITTWNR